MNIKFFGLQVKNVGSFAALYQEVDYVLTNSKLVREQALVHALQEMMKPQKHFSICTINSAAEMFGIVIPRERLHIYQLSHCIDWSDMTVEFRQALTAMIFDDFRTILNPQTKTVEVL